MDVNPLAYLSVIDIHNYVLKVAIVKHKQKSKMRVFSAFCGQYVGLMLAA